MLELLVASSNKGKVKEIKSLLKNQTIILRSLRDFENIKDVEETGTTFAENAALKAISYARQTSLWTIADDSGLEVAALKDQPGVFSARYAGEGSTDAENTNKILKKLKETKAADRSAQFICAIHIADQNGKIQFTAEGVCPGTIALTPIGINGFGYDPIFIPDGFDRTFGELSSEKKKEISHRAIAVKKIIEYLSQIAVS